MALPFPGTIPKPAVSFFGLGREFTVLRQGAEHRWLREYGHKEVKYTLKYLADAYRKFWTGQGQQPRCKARQRTTDGFTIPSHVAVSDTHLRMPRIGWLRVQGSNLYTDCQPLQARIRKEGPATQPKWYVSVVYAVPVTQVRPGAPTGALGLDRNVGQATASDGTVHRMTDTARLDARLKRHQRRLARQRQGSCRSRRIAGQLTKLHQPAPAHPGPRHTPYQPEVGQRGAYRGPGELVHARHDPFRPGHRGAAGETRHGQGRAQPQHSRQRLGAAGTEGDLQVQPSHPCQVVALHQPDVQPVWLRGPAEPACAVPVLLYRLSISVARRSQCGDQHSGESRSPCGPGDGGRCAARGVLVRDPDDPRTRELCGGASP